MSDSSHDPGPCHCIEVSFRVACDGLEDIAESIRRKHREGEGHVWLGDADRAADREEA